MRNVSAHHYSKEMFIYLCWRFSLSQGTFKAKVKPKSDPFFRTFSLDFLWFHYETIIQTGITCNKFSCYMRDSACRLLIVENPKTFQSCIKVFLIFPRERNCRILFGLCKLVFMNYPIMFLDWDNKTKLLSASLSCFLDLLW